MIATALRALGAALGAVPQLNLWVRTAPRGTEEFCWHIDIVPRLTIRAGFELGTGVDINVYPPERAAADLREALGVSHRQYCAAADAAEPAPLSPLHRRRRPGGRPYGRWEERLSEAFAAACAPLAAEAGTALDPRRCKWFPDRAWGGRTYVPAIGRAAEPTTATRRVDARRVLRPRLVPAATTRRADRAARDGRLHRRHRRREPRLADRPQRRRARRLAGRRRPRRRRHADLGPAAGPRRARGDGRARRRGARSGGGQRRPLHADRGRRGPASATTCSSSQLWDRR